MALQIRARTTGVGVLGRPCAVCIAIALLVVIGSACHGSSSHSAAAADPLVLMESVADWQLRQFQKRTGYPAEVTPATWEPRGWIQGVFFAGLADLATRSGAPRFAQALMERGAVAGWRLGDRLYHAEDQVIGQAYLWAYSFSHDPATLAPMQRSFEAILADPPSVGLDFTATSSGGYESACQARWCWSDALFMAPRTWVGLAAALHDVRYLDYANAEFWAATDYLYDRQEHLYYRDSRYFKGANGRKVFWSRGNGWVLAGIARVLEALPRDHPSRPRYEGLMREMAARVVTLRNANGYWPVSLLGGRSSAPETSGTALFVYGLAWGINHGVLDRKSYGPSVDSGWSALVRAVDVNGKLGWVQQVDSAPRAARAGDTQFYGAGAFLLAGGQVRDLRSASKR
jgi:unsaturated rhamnogalacturonyl hydrolase